MALGNEDRKQIIICVIMAVVALLQWYNAIRAGIYGLDIPGYPLHTIAFVLMGYSGKQQIVACAHVMWIHWQTHKGSYESNEDDELLNMSIYTYFQSHIINRIAFPCVMATYIEQCLFGGGFISGMALAVMLIGYICSVTVARPETGFGYFVFRFLKTEYPELFAIIALYKGDEQWVYLFVFWAVVSFTYSSPKGFHNNNPSVLGNNRFSVVPQAHSLAMTALPRDALGLYNVDMLDSAHCYTVFASLLLVIVANPGIFVKKKLNRGN